MTKRLPLSDRDWDRADAWLGLLSPCVVIALTLVISRLGTITPFLAALTLLSYLSHPYLLLRIVSHFRRVPLAWPRALLAFAVAATVLSALLPRPKPASLWLGISFATILLEILAAAILAMAARAYHGLTAWRLNLTALGTALFGLTLIATLLGAHGSTAEAFKVVIRLRLMLWMPIAMLAAFTLGLLPPRWLRRSLQRNIEYRFLRRTSEHPPSERARLIPIDLAHAAVRSTLTAATIVVIGDGPLQVVGASEPRWRGLTIDPMDGAIGRALTAKSVLWGDIRELEPAVQSLATDAERFLVVPIAGARHVWGALVIMQRRGSLFPADDLAILERLCRYTAEAFDHAQLIADERAHQQREADARLDLILESLQDYAVITIDDGGSITSWNVGASQMFQYPADDAIGQPVSRLFDDAAPWLPDQLQLARLGEPMIADTVGRRRDDSRLTTSLVIRPLVTRGRRTGGFVIVMRDVSQQRQLEDRLRQSQKLEAIGRLAAGVAHDFNNMLTVILGHAANLDEVVPEEHRSGLNEIRKAGERAAALTKQLLAFSRQQVLQSQIVNLPDVVSSLVPMLSRLLGEHIQVVKQVDTVVPRVMADVTQLEQVVMNLAVNARDAMPSGGQLTISVQSVRLTAEEAAPLATPPGPYAMLEVTDTGSGVDQATKARMFEPFFTTKGVGRGTGLGLAIVYGIVQQMHGAITIDSEVGRGTAFRIYLPARIES